MKLTGFIGLPFLALGLLVFASCASTDEVLVNKEPGFYYGTASAASEDQALEAALNDLVYNVLQESGSATAERKAKFQVTPEMKQAFAGFKLSPFSKELNKQTGKTAVIYRLAFKDWDKAETARLAKLRADLGGRFTGLVADTKKPLFGRVGQVAALSLEVQKHGAGGKLAVSDTDSRLLLAAIEAFVSASGTGLSLSVSPDSGLIKTGGVVKAVVLDASGKPLANAQLLASWSSGAGVVTKSPVTTDAAGKVDIALPDDAKLRNQKISLKLASDFASLVPSYTLLAKLDAANVKEWAFRHDENLAALGSDEVKFAAGTYDIGGVKQDRRAGSVEKARKVTLKAFAMDRKLVTNGQYLAYLEATNAPVSQYPDYWDNPDFNQPDQPVIGVSVAEAKAYAEWVSKLLGVQKRLPTEAEYEVAARAGNAATFPWGEQAPSDGVRANFRGNGKFTNTSPVGSFPAGNNVQGMADMVGNVWQWTTTPNGTDGPLVSSGDPAWFIVKGGSFLDGQYDLRISNRQVRDPAEGHSDVGFRLVREVGNE